MKRQHSSRNNSVEGLTDYSDQWFRGNIEERARLLKTSTTLYVGNLSFFTDEYQIHALFSYGGDLKRVIMGIDRFDKTPCGFCFVEYYNREDAERGMNYINGMRIDDRVIRTDWDTGFENGRQFGRGKSGGQVRDEYRRDNDEDRGGYGHLIKRLSENKKD